MPIVGHEQKKKSKGIVKWALIVLAVVVVYNIFSGPATTPKKPVEEVQDLVKQQSLFNIGNITDIHVETLCKVDGEHEGVNFVIKDGSGNVLPDYRLFFTVDLDGDAPTTTKGWKEIKINEPGQMTMTEAFFLTAFESKEMLDNGRAKMKFVITKTVPAVNDDVWVETGSRVVLYGAAINSSNCSTLTK